MGRLGARSAGWMVAAAMGVLGLVLAAAPRQARAQVVPILDARIVLPHEYKDDEYHEKGVWNAQVTPDGSRVVTYYDQVVRVWDGRTGAKLFDLSGHKAAVSVIKMNQDGRLVASVARDKSLRVWSVSTGKLERDFGIRDARIKWLGFTRDGALVTVDFSGTLSILDLADGSVRKAYPVEKKGVFSIELDADASRFMVVRRNRTLALFSVPTGRLLATHGEAADENVSSGIACFSRDGSTIAYLWADGKLHFWQPASSADADDRTVFDPPSSVETLAFSPDGKRLLLGLADDVEQLAIQVRDAQTGLLQGILRGHASTMEMSFTADGRTVVSAGGKDTSVRIWDMPEAAPAAVRSYWDRYARNFEAAYFDGRQFALDPLARFDALAYSADGRTLVSQSYDDGMLWDMTRRERRAQPVLSIADHRIASPKSEFVDDQRLLMLSNDGGTRLWDTAANRIVDSQLPKDSVWVKDMWLGATKQNFLVHLVHGSSFNGTGMMATSNKDGFDIVEVRRIASGEVRSRFEMRGASGEGSLLNVAYLEDSNSVVACLAEHRFAILDAASGKEIGSFGQGEARTRSSCLMALTKDGLRLAEADDFGDLNVWSLRDRRLLFSARRGVKHVASLVFSADGQNLLVGSSDYSEKDGVRNELMTLEAYSVPSGHRLFAVPATAIGSVTSIAYSPDGKSFVTAHQMSRVGSMSGLRVWNAATGEPLPR